MSEKLVCQICNMEFKNNRGLSCHIRQKHLTLPEYYDTYIGDHGKCKMCDKETKFVGLNIGYRIYCSCKCAMADQETKDKAKITNLKIYGVEHPSQIKDVFDKKIATWMKNYGVTNPMKDPIISKKCSDSCMDNNGVPYPYQNEKIRNKGKETCLKNNGVENPYQSEEIRNKGKETCLKNYGVENPSQSDVVQEKIEETNLERYGCRNPLNNDAVKKKTDETNLERYGCINPAQNDDIKNKIEETNIKNFGFKTPYQSEEIRNKGKETCLQNHGVEHPMQNKKIAEKVSIARKLKFHEGEERYPDVFMIEGLIEGPNGEILGHCKNADCPNSAEKGEYFVLSTDQIIVRNRGINSTSDIGYFYCCDECKHECIAYGKSAKQLSNIFNPVGNLNQASTEDLYIWRKEVFMRQLKNNPDHELNFCEKCHSEEDLHCHHELPQKLYPGYSLDPINGVILCRKCHYEIGHEKGTECSTGYLSNKICK